MKRKQTQSSGKPDRTKLAGKDTQSSEPRYGEGSASALASLKKLERDRAKERPTDDDRPTS